MRLGISGTHGTGKTTLAEELCMRLTSHSSVDEPFYLLEEEGYQFDFPPSLADYRAQLRQSLRLLATTGHNIIFDRTPLDFLAYLTVQGSDIQSDVEPAALRSAFASLDLLIVTPITAEIERVLPAAEMPALRTAVDAALLDLLYDDPFDAWRGTPILELTCPLQLRTDTVLATLTAGTR